MGGSSKQAMDLSGQDLDVVIRFPWKWDTGVQATVTGLLREVHQQPNEVTLWLTDPVVPSGDKTELCIDPRTWIEMPEDK